MVSEIYDRLNRSGFFPLCYELHPQRLQEEALRDCSPAGQFLFEKYRSHLSLYHNLPLDLVFEQMETIASPLLGEYVEVGGNEEFGHIKADFFYGLFWNDELYVSFEDFNEYLEQVSVPPELIPRVEEIKRKYYFPEGKSLQLWYRGEEDTNLNMNFIHIETGLQVPKPDGKSELIRVRWDGYTNSSRYQKWFRLAYTMLIDKQNISLMQHLATKKLKVHFMNEVDSGIKELINAIYNGHPFFFDKSGNYAILSGSEVMSASEAKEFESAVMVNGDRELAELGRVANTNPKFERMTTGENYKDLLPLANRQRLTLDELNKFSREVESRFGLKLSFAINGVPEALPLEGDAEQPRPNESQALTGAPEAESRLKYNFKK